MGGGSPAVAGVLTFRVEFNIFIFSGELRH
jgi:hypothetical protein